MIRCVQGGREKKGPCFSNIFRTISIQGRKRCLKYIQRPSPIFFSICLQQVTCMMFHKCGCPLALSFQSTRFVLLCTPHYISMSYVCTGAQCKLVELQSLARTNTGHAARNTITKPWRHLFSGSKSASGAVRSWERCSLVEVSGAYGMMYGGYREIWCAPRFKTSASMLAGRYLSMSIPHYPHLHWDACLLWKH